MNELRGARARAAASGQNPTSEGEVGRGLGSIKKRRFLTCTGGTSHLDGLTVLRLYQ